MPCVWLRTSAAVHKIALTTATLIVTSLLVASPVLFLLSTAPSQLPKDCNAKNDFNCQLPTRSPALECDTPQCRSAAISIQARINWKMDPCEDFKNFSCGQTRASLKIIKSAQEAVDLQMQRNKSFYASLKCLLYFKTFSFILELLKHNTTSGTFQKLGRLYESCLRQTLNSSSIRQLINELGGYMSIGVSGPLKMAALLARINRVGPTPLVSVYYDLSYGRKPQSMLIIDSSLESSPVLQNPVRWTGPKSAPFDIRQDLPPLLDRMLDFFLPVNLEFEKRLNESNKIRNFIKELNQLRRESIRKEFTDSYVLYNVSMLTSTYPFVS